MVQQSLRTLKRKLRNLLRQVYYQTLFFVEKLPVFGLRLLQPLPFLHLDRQRLYPPRSVAESSREWVTEAQRTLGLADAAYVLIDPAEPVHRSTVPKTCEPTVHPQFQREQEATIPEAFVTIVPQGRVLGEMGTILTPDNQLLLDVSLDRRRSLNPNQKHLVQMRWPLLPLHRLAGTIAVLATCGSSMYYHWMVDCLLRYALLGRAGFTVEEIDYFLVDGKGRPYQGETLALLGIPAEKIIDITDYFHVQGDRLLVPSYPTLHGQFRSWHLDFLRQSFLPHAADLGDRSGKRLYISRGKAKIRQMLNEAAIIDCLQRYGFQAVQLENFSFREQVALMAQAEVVLAPHGSGLTNIIFCQPGTRVIEIFSPELVALYYWKISAVLGLDYYYILGEGYVSPTGEQSWDATADIRVNLENLEQTLALAGIQPLS